MGHIFVSYSSKDREFVAKLVADLEQAGYETWFDRADITGQQAYWAEIKAGIEGCSQFLFVISPESINGVISRRIAQTDAYSNIGVSS